MSQIEEDIRKVRADIERGQAELRRAEGLIELLGNQLQEARKLLVEMKLEREAVQ